MHILLYSISYSPEVAGSGRFNGELAQWLADHGHYVDVITAYPYYPEWKTRAEYQGKGWFTEKVGNLTVYRTPLYIPKRVTSKNRILHELSFALSSLIHLSRLLFKHYDVLIGVCPPLQAGLMPYIFSRLKRSPFVFHIQDLQVDTARNLGLIKNKRLLNFLAAIEQYLLRNSDFVSSISEGMKRNILSKGTPIKRYRMNENWVDIDTFTPLSIQESLRSELGFSTTDKIVLYSGNIGEKQGLEILIEVANYLIQYTNIILVIVGEGVARKKLVQQAEDKGLKNIRFLPPVLYADLPRMLSMADIHLVIQKRATSDLVMPSKLVNILAVGGAAIVSAKRISSLSSVILDNQLGWVVEPEESDELGNTILKALNSSQLDYYRFNARKYAEKNLSKKDILSRFENMLSELIYDNPR